SVVNDPTRASNQPFGPNWLVLILPYMEQGPLYNQFSASINSYLNDGNTTWMGIRTTPIPSYLCPSDTGAQIAWDQRGGNWARGNYACNAGGIHQGDTTAWTSTENGSSPTYHYNPGDYADVPNGTA